MCCFILCCWVCVGVCSGNELGAEGAKALAPSLAKLTQLQTLYLGGEWSVFGALCVHVCVPPVCGFGLCVHCRVSAMTVLL